MNSIQEAKTIFMLGIAGSGMRGLASLLHFQGKAITGTDAQLVTRPHISQEKDLQPYTLANEENAAELLAKADVMVYTDAAPEHHPLRVYAKEHNLPACPYYEALGEFAQQYETIAVAGTHGKSSTTAFLAHILMKAEKDPTVLVGAGMSTLPGKHARLGKGPYFIVEADEYRKHFLPLRPSHVVITTIDFDHPDYFSSLDNVKEAYSQFLKTIRSKGIAVVPKHVYADNSDLAWPPHTETVPAQSNSGFPAPIPGEHMKQNAALAIRIAELVCEVPSHEAVAHLQSFPGLERRMETLGTYSSMDIVTDYAHHPAEIVATLQAMREQRPAKKVLVIFEAHMQERLSKFFDNFVTALSLADGVLIYPPFSPSGREQSSLSDLAAQLATQLATRNIVVKHLTSSKELAPMLKELSSEFDAVVGLSAGDLDSVLRKLVAT